MSEWSLEEIKMLTDNKLTNRQIADLTGRNYNAVRVQRCRVRDGRSTRALPAAEMIKKKWTNEQLRMLFDPNVPLAELAKIRGCTLQAVYKKRQHLRAEGITTYIPDPGFDLEDTDEL